MSVASYEQKRPQKLHFTVSDSNHAGSANNVFNLDLLRKNMETLFDYLVQKKKDKHGVWHFDCPIGLWSVSCNDKQDAEREACVYFNQYLADGEYDQLMRTYGMEK